MQGIAAERLLGQEIGKSYFGANILATRDRLEPDDTYDDMACPSSNDLEQGA